MTNQFQRSSAKIYQFPRRVAAPITPRRDKETDLSLQPAPAIEAGAWYHQAAIQEAERARKP